MGTFDWLITILMLLVAFALGFVATLLAQMLTMFKRMESKLDRIIDGPWEE